MSIIDALRQELEQEAHITRRVLERVPADRLTWKPHDKSMSLGQLALHVATIPGAIAQMSQCSPYAVGQFNQPAPATAAELLPLFEGSIAQARQVLGTLDDQALGAMWCAMNGETEVMNVPVGALLRTLMLNHWYHHRGQLSVYLREVGVPVPSIYGPSADENPFAPRAAAAVSV
jgi:uncharacterized damage-inducible protein DinB